MEKEGRAFSLVIKNGRVIDPSQKMDGVYDIGVKGTKITAIEKEIPVRPHCKIIDAKGKIITSGLIDIHTHVYEHVVFLGVNPDVIGVKSGVTTVIDAGSSGHATFPGFRQFIVSSSRTTIYAFLHIAPTGLCTAPEVRPWDEISIKTAARVVERNRDLIRGIKMRDAGPFTVEQRLDMFKKARLLARETRLPLMVHFGNHEAPTEGNLSREMLPLMEKGDIVSHVYTPHTGRLFGTDGTPLPELIEAKQRGVILDVSRGKNNIGFEVARHALDNGILPDTISTDVTAGNYLGPVFNLATVISQFMSLGVKLEQAIEMTTANPARALGLADEFGSLKVGRQADISIFRLIEGEWEFQDSVDKKIPANKLLVPVSTIKAGQEIIAEPVLRG